MRFAAILPTFMSTMFHLSIIAAPPSPPGLTYLFTANVTLEPAIDIGVGPYGQRVAIPIVGGTFSGPNINGTILDLGADWGWTDTHNPSGITTFHPDTRYQLRTSDGANIYIQTEGPAQVRSAPFISTRVSPCFPLPSPVNMQVGAGAEVLTSS